MARSKTRGASTSSISIEIDEQFPCPFCGKTVKAGWSTDGRARVLMHPWPQCKTYDELSGEDYVTAVRAKQINNSPC